MITSPLIPLPHPFPWYQGGVYNSQHLTDEGSPLPYCNKLPKKANNR